MGIQYGEEFYSYFMESYFVCFLDVGLLLLDICDEKSTEIGEQQI